MEKQYHHIQVEKKGKISVIRFNRLEKKNALSEAMRTEIIDALNSLQEEKRIKAKKL